MYQVQIQEVFDNHGISPNKERAKICFDTLEGLLENIGNTYSSVMRIIIDELKKTVYSQVMTSSAVAPFYEPVPYCVLVKRINEKRC